MAHDEGQPLAGQGRVGKNPSSTSGQPQIEVTFEIDAKGAFGQVAAEPSSSSDASSEEEAAPEEGTEKEELLQLAMDMNIRWVAPSLATSYTLPSQSASPRSTRTSPLCAGTEHC